MDVEDIICIKKLLEIKKQCPNKYIEIKDVIVKEHMKKKKQQEV
ncbi:hypothetical protein [Metaclostridioides mangenotii]|nr:hypothetical protein [Clostridioides mangenotii]